MKNNLSKNLKKIRKDNNLSQEQLADELGVSRQAISKWESAVAYPEMDKILALCDKFDLNTDDLLNKDISEVKGEEESKKKFNKTLDEMLNFITDSINLFGNMKLKSKMKCLFEQVIIAGILSIISVIIVVLGNSLFSSLFGFLPNKATMYIENVLSSILIVFCFISSIIILTHIFKIRYLNYYNEIKREKISVEDDNNEESKISFKEESKIIIRDPKHSEYKFAKSLFKIIIGVTKFFALCFLLGLCLWLIGLVVLFVLSFLISKTGIFFIGVLLAILSLIVITIIISLILLNFVFNRKNNKKLMIWSFIASLIMFGVGSGFITIGSLNFEVVDESNLVNKEQVEIDMKKGLFFDDSDYAIYYREANINNIKVEYNVNKYCKSNISSEFGKVEDDYKEGLYLHASCNDPMKIVKMFINNLNDKKITSFSSPISNITIYASKDTLNEMKINYENYHRDNDED